MKITMYELLGMIKDRKAPKRIRFLNHYYMWKENDEDYQKEDGLMLFGNIKINYILNSEVEILEEKKIPEKLSRYVDECNDLACEWSFEGKKLKNKMNEIIDYLEKENNNEK